MTVYAIGDIHGHLGLLQRAHDRIAADQATAGPGTVVHVGDLVDRGPDSRGVVEYLRAGIVDGQDWVVLKGNHDRMFTRFLADPRDPEHGLRADLSWLHPKLGGAETLQSYGVRSASDRPVARVHADALAMVPEDHRSFLTGRPAMHRAPGLVFVHAGIRPGVPLGAQTETDLVWIRSPFLEDARDHGVLVVHGHTALDAPVHYGNRLNIDSGAAYGGPLTAVVIEEAVVWHLTDRGRVRLQP
jgi:serine/threonine protein phosphatase 1